MANNTVTMNVTESVIENITDIFLHNITHTQHPIPSLGHRNIFGLKIFFLFIYNYYTSQPSLGHKNFLGHRNIFGLKIFFSFIITTQHLKPSLGHINISGLQIFFPS